MPKSSDFNYSGLKVENAGDWNSLDYHNRTQEPVEPTKKPKVKPQGLGLAGRQTNMYDYQKKQAELQQASKADWKSKGLTNNKIIDN